MSLSRTGLGGNIVPTGAVLPYTTSTAPTDWLLCDGSAVSRTTYASLFNVVGTTYGSGDGSTTFNLPDLRGRTIAGKDDMGGSAANRITSGGSGITGTTLGAAGGTQTHTLTTSQLPSHSHGVTDPTHFHFHLTGGAAYVASSRNAGAGNIVGGLTTSNTTGLTLQNAGSGSAHNNMQPYILTNYIIKA